MRVCERKMLRDGVRMTIMTRLLSYKYLYTSTDSSETVVAIAIVLTTSKLRIISGGKSTPPLLFIVFVSLHFLRALRTKMWILPSTVTSYRYSLHGEELRGKNTAERSRERRNKTNKTFAWKCTSSRVFHYNLYVIGFLHSLFVSTHMCYTIVVLFTR